MSVPLAADVGLEAVFGGLLSAVLQVKYKAAKFRHALECLESTLRSIEPVIKEIELFNRQLDRTKEETETFIKEMKGGRELVLKCSKVKWWEYYFKSHYQEKLEAFNESLRRFFYFDVQAQMARDPKEALVEVRDSHMEVKKLDDIHEPSSSLPAEEEFPYQELLNLIGIRDFISLLLTYPVKVADDESMLKAWLSDVLQWTAQLSMGMPTDDYGLLREQSRLLTEKPLRYMKGLVPLEILREIECGGRFIFKNNDLIPTPEAILDLTVDLAVGQLIQTLPSENTHYVRLSTRNNVERRAVTEKIEIALKDKNMVGIDKTFLGVIRIDASIYESDVEIHVQEAIAQQLKHMMTTGVQKKYDDILCIDAEMASKRYLLLLVDGDGNKKLAPQKVCFPRNNVTGFVVLITTEQSSEYQRSDEDEFTRAMDLNIRTQDHLLPWQVFCSYVGSNIVHSSNTIQRIAVQIVKECRGHLLATVLVAKFLKNVEDVELWELALHKLCYMNPFYDYQESDRIGISRVMVNAFVNIIWEGIDRRQKLCLEHSLFVPNIKDGVPGDVLISDWISTELVHSKEEAEHDIRELLDHAALLQCESSYICLPKETYNILESLHRSNPSFIRHGALGLMEPPHIGRWHGLIRIELMDNNLSELPDSPNCPKLEVLLLQGNVDLIEIPDSFFDHMPLLRYLDLSYTSVRVLPCSLFNLKELKKFHLRSCELFMELSPEIGQLKNLEKLDLDGTLITHLPKEIQELTNLQSLTLHFHGYHHKLGSSKKGKQCFNPTIIPPVVISNLTQLNYLSITVDPEDERWHENATSIVPEIFGLEKLEMVNIYVPRAELLKNVPSSFSLDFRLVVGHHMQRFISRAPLSVEEKFKESDRSLKFVNGVDVPGEVNNVLACSRALYLDRHMTIKSLCEFQRNTLNMLRVCILAGCNEMETIVDGSYSYDWHSLSHLEILSVSYMKKLRSICEGPPLLSFLHSLRSIALHTCPMLTTIFTLDFLGNLSLLEELIVEDCPKVTTLISYESSEHDTRIFLPRLRIISLLYLPELVSISSGLHIGQHLRKLGIFCCPKLLTLSKTEVSSNSLRVIIGESKWWEALKWKEAEQGEAGQSNSLNLIFSPINEEADIMTQLVAHDDEDEQQVEPENEIEGEGMKEDSPATIILKPDMHSEETCIGNVDNLGFTFRGVNRDDSDIHSYSIKSSASIPVTQREGEILQFSNLKRFSYSDDYDTSSYGWDDYDASSYGWDDYDVSPYSSKSSASIPVTQGVGKIFQSPNLKRSYSSKSSASIPVTQTEGEILQSSDLKSFSYTDLRTATRNFRPDIVLGEGGFGKVFKGWIDEHSLAGTKPGKGMVVAVKKFVQDGLQSHNEWVAEIKYLGKLKHPNLVKLIGYCLEDEHRLLVYEFMPKGSVDNHLFRRSSYSQPLSWSLRLKIALGAARALAFLHSTEVQVIHRSFKTSDILLDANYNAKLSDFGLAREGPTGDRSHVTTRVMGTYGFAAPEYIATGHLYIKSDVYNFGVALLEMLSGRRVMDMKRPSGQHNLVEWAKPYLSNKRRVFRVMDPHLEGKYSLNQAQSAAALALQCLAFNPKSRPNMDEVVRALEKLQESKDKQKSADQQEQVQHHKVHKGSTS